MFDKRTLRGFVSGIIVATLAIQITFASPFKRQLEAVYNNIKVVVHGIQIDLKDPKGNKVEPFVVAGTTYLPVRAVSEALGEPVRWDSKTQTVFIGPEKTKSGNIGIVELNKIRPAFNSRPEIGHTIRDKSYVIVRTDKYSAQDSFTGSATYFLKGEFTKMKGLYVVPDDYSHGQLLIRTDGEDIPSQYIQRGSVAVPIEVNLVGVDELQITSNGFGYLINLEFEPIKK